MASKIFFASDFHLGLDHTISSQDRERKIVQWLDDIKTDATAIYFLGDLFDYWYEYKHVIPKGFHRFIAKVLDLKDQGVAIYFFTGNHDVWMFDYFQSYYDIPVYRDPVEITLQNKKLLIGHGDGLGPGDKGYKIIKKIFRNSFAQWCFSRLHPNLAIYIMKSLSQKSRDSQSSPETFLGTEKEWLVQYCEYYLKERNKVDYFIFGHRHLALDHTLSNDQSRYINTGDWISLFSYAVLENGKLSLRYYKD